MKGIFKTVLIGTSFCCLCFLYSGILEASPVPQAVQPGAQVSGGQAARGNEPVSVIEDISVHRRRPLELVRSLEEQIDLELKNVDFEADVLAVIDGFEVTQEMFRQYLVMGHGVPEIERFETAILSELGRESRIATGADPAEFEVAEETIDQEIKQQLTGQKNMQPDAPTPDFEEFKKRTEVAYGWEEYRSLMKAVMSFGKVYLPDAKPLEGPSTQGKQPAAINPEPDALDPDLPVSMNLVGDQVNIYLPIVTWNVLSIDERSRQMRDYVNEAYKNGKPVAALLKPQIIRLIKSALLNALNQEFFYSGNLNPGVFFKIKDRELFLDDIYRTLENRVSWEDKMFALREILVLKAMDRALKDAGCLFTEAEAEAAYAAHEAEYGDATFSLDFMIRLSGFYNQDRYKNIYQRYANFEKMIADELKDEARLKDYYEGAARLLFETGSVDLQIIFFSILDDEHLHVRENGYAWASEKMATVLEELKNGEDFAVLCKKYEDPKGTYTMHDFDPLNLSDLRDTFGETWKSTLLSGFSMADYLFYRGSEGEIVGPFVREWGDLGTRNRRGIYLIKIECFRRGRHLGDFDRAREMAAYDYTEKKFHHWAQETLKGSKIELTLKDG